MKAFYQANFSVVIFKAVFYCGAVDQLGCTSYNLPKYNRTQMQSLVINTVISVVLFNVLFKSKMVLMFDSVDTVDEIIKRNKFNK